MALQWVDDVKVAIVARLEDALPDQRDAIDTARGIASGADNATPIPLLYVTADTWMPQTLPCCEIVCNDSQRIDESGATPKEYRHSLTVVCTIAGTDEELLDAQMIRLMLAVMLVLDGWHTSTAGITNGSEIIAGGITYDLVQSSDVEGRPFIKSGLLSVTTDQFL